MKTPSVEPTTLTQFHRLVSEAELFSNKKLDETCENYLVFLRVAYRKH